MKERVQTFGRFLSGMVMPNIGAFIAWGLIAALFIEKGWIPVAAFAELVKAGYDEAILYERKPIALGALEKTLSKEHRQEILSKYIVKPQGKPTLAPEDDKRPAMVLQRVSAEEAFGGDNTYSEGGK